MSDNAAPAAGGQCQSIYHSMARSSAYCGSTLRASLNKRLDFAGKPL